MNNKYIRKIIDINRYISSIKKDKLGNAKIEGRDDKIKVHIYMKDIYEEPDYELKAYLFKDYNDKTEGKYIGTLDIKNNIGELKTVLDRKELNTLKFGISDISGIIIVYENNSSKSIQDRTSFVAMTKSNKLVNIMNITKTLIPKEIIKKSVKEEIILDNNSKVNQVEDKIEEDKVEEKLEEKVEEEEKVEAVEEVEQKSKDKRESKKDESSQIANEVIEELDIISLKSNKAKKVTEKDDKDIINVRLEPDKTKVINHIKKSKEIHSSDVDEYPKFKSELLSNELFNNQFDSHELLEMQGIMFEKYPRMQPFENGINIQKCIRIEPKDIAVLPINIWMLMNNTFLLGGYEKYKHLILCREDDNTTKSGFKYTIGVPGIYHKKDRFIAYLYGFNKFRCCEDTYPKAGEYGYWIIEVMSGDDI